MKKFICPHCQKEFDNSYSLKQHIFKCGKNPDRKIMSYHKGKYHGIRCDSSWVLAFLVWHLDNNKYIERCKEKRQYIFEDKTKIYFPDFVTDDGIIEIKGSNTKNAKAKKLYNPDIKVLYTREIKPYIEYAKTKYGENFWEILYDKN